MATIQLIRKLPDFFLAIYFCKDFQIQPYLKFFFLSSKTIFLCPFVFQFFTTESFVLSYCDNIKCLTLIPHHFTFTDYMETIQLIRKLPDFFWRPSRFSGRFPDCLPSICFSLPVFTKEKSVST